MCSCCCMPCLWPAKHCSVKQHSETTYKGAQGFAPARMPGGVNGQEQNTATLTAQEHTF